MPECFVCCLLFGIWVNIVKKMFYFIARKCWHNKNYVKNRKHWYSGKSIISQICGLWSSARITSHTHTLLTIRGQFYLLFISRQRDTDKVLVLGPDGRGAAQPAPRPRRAALHHRRPVGAVTQPAPTSTVVKQVCIQSPPTSLVYFLFQYPEVTQDPCQIPPRTVRSNLSLFLVLVGRFNQFKSKMRKTLFCFGL